MDKDFYYLWLTTLVRVSLYKLHACLDIFGSPKALFDAKEQDLMELTPLTAAERSQILSARNRQEAARIFEKTGPESCQFISRIHPAYPRRLRELRDAPFGLYIKGSLPPEDRPAVAVIGARNSTIYGRELAYHMARELAETGMVIVSGLAAGIDGAGHRGCLDAGGYTLGILGSGIHVVYPKENYRLYQEMERRGGILSEYPPDTKPLPMLFPRRNRIISMLSDFVLVVEAREKSGSLITADFALEQGKDIGAVPGRPCDPLSIGCNRLIQQGAKCILSPEDIVEEFKTVSLKSGLNQKREHTNLELGLAPKEKMVYSCLRLEPSFIDEILCQLDLPAWEGIQLLTELEIKGIIKQYPHHYYYKIYNGE